MKNRSIALMSIIAAVLLTAACNAGSGAGTGQISMIVTGNVRGQYNLCG
ncbi:MAG: hypothetical protein V3U16_04685 [Candidatus Neomarinimicrobiota bacterium]